MDNPIYAVPLQPYVYTSLEAPASQTRLLEIRNTDDSETRIECTLRIWTLEDAPPFYAISYTWGSEDRVESVRLNDGLTRIRKNCADVLRQLIHFKSTRYYWIDALCID